MNRIYRTAEGERLVRERYAAFLKHWPVERQEFHIPTSQGETFVIASGTEGAPSLLLLHSGGANAGMWIGEVRAFAEHFRVYAVDMIGEPGFSAPSRPPLVSDAHAVWLDEVLRYLSVDRVSIVGASLGGWLALDYATRRPERVERIAVLCPGGVGRQKIGIVFVSLASRLCGAWGKRKLMERILGRPPAGPPPAVKAFVDFMTLIRRHFRHRMVKLPIFSDEALRRLNMPLLAVVGGRDVLLDSAGTKRRLERHVPQAQVVFLPEAGHLIPGQYPKVRAFLQESCA